MTGVGNDGSVAFQINPWKRPNISTSWAGSILAPQNSCNLISLMCRNKQVGNWSDRGLNNNYTAVQTGINPLYNAVTTNGNSSRNILEGPIS